MVAESVFHFVVSSRVRVNILSEIASSPETKDNLVDHLDASSPAVYTALSDLDERGLIRETDAGRALTGRGRLLLDVIEQWQGLADVFETDQRYWKTHDTGALPQEFRRRLPELDEYEVVRSERPDIRAHARAIVSVLEDAPYCRTAIPFYVPEYRDPFPDSEDSQIIFPPDLIDQLHAEVVEGTRDRILVYDDTKYRVSDVGFGVLVTEDSMMLGLRRYGQDMWEAVVVSETDSAIQWAAELHEHLWASAEPARDYIDRNYPSRDR